MQQPGSSRHCSSLGSVGPRTGLAFRCGTHFSPYSPHHSKASSRRFQGHSPPQAFFGLFLCHVTLLSQIPSPHGPPHTGPFPMGAYSPVSPTISSSSSRCVPSFHVNRAISPGSGKWSTRQLPARPLRNEVPNNVYTLFYNVRQIYFCL